LDDVGAQLVPQILPSRYLEGRAPGRFAASLAFSFYAFRFEGVNGNENP
jgi:hypothetical protein